MSVLSIPEAVAINFAGQCDRGKVREENQDAACHTSARLGELLVVAGGIGGSAGGGQASRMAVDTILSSVEGMPAFIPPEIAVEEAVCRANAAIASAAAEPDCPDSRMGTTVVVALLRTETGNTHAPVQAIIGYVGDSRAYLVHDRKLTLLTRDHSAKQDLPDDSQITLQEGATHPDQSQLTRYLGLELNVLVGMREVPLEVGDTLLLCSNGLWGYIPEIEIERVLADGTRSVDEASRALLNLALDAGGHDNVAIEIARVNQSYDSAATAASTVEPRFEAPPESVDEASRAPLNLALDAVDHDNVAVEIARVNQSCDSAATDASTDEPRSEAPPGSVEEASSALLNLALDTGSHDNVAVEIARVAQSYDSTATDASTVEPRSEAPPENKSVREFATASDTSPSEWPDSPVVLERVTSTTELPPPKKKKVFSLIRGFGRHVSDKDAMTEKPAAAEPAALPVSGVQPTVSWATPEPIAYGTGLSPVQLNATASVQGKFVYTPGPGYVLPAGTHTLWVAFHAADSPEDNPVLAGVPITVSKAAPSIQWLTPSNVRPGVALGADQLNASASIPGTFEYTPSAGEALLEGMHTLWVTFNPKDKANYTTAQAYVSVAATKTVPEINWTSPEPIPCGTPLGAAELNASASVPGTLEYSPACGEVLSAGSHTLSVTFTPSDGTGYAIALATVPLTVTRGTPAILWPLPERITYGIELNETQLNATASVPGTFLYNPGPGAVLAAGEHTPSVVFTPSNLADYTPAQAAVPLSVAKLTPAISWPAPDPINSATPLGSAQLNASASLPGTLTYSPAAGETLGPGAHTLSVTFTPSDCVNCSLAQASVSLTVTEITPAVITWLSPPSISYGTALGDEQLSASSPVPGSFLYTPAAGDVLPPGEHKLSVIFTPEDQERYTEVKADVTLTVKGLPDVGSLLRAASQIPPASGVAAQSAAAPAAEQGVVRKDDQPAPRLQRETRTYKGAIYERGDDRQWHLQRQ